MKTPALLLLALSVALTGCGSSERAAKTVSAGPDELVNVGYGHMTKAELPYSVSKVEPDKGSYRHYNSIYDMLAGIPGVHVSGTTVIIRGASSINASSDPLYVVDGTVVGNISSLSPEEVQNIEILKDGSSAMYGVRGSGGVIMITTKSAYSAQQAEREAKAAERAARKAAKKK